MLELKDVNKSERWILTAFEVMKYNPKYRDSYGSYLKDEWTSYSDISELFDGVVLTFWNIKS